MAKILSKRQTTKSSGGTCHVFPPSHDLAAGETQELVLGPLLAIMYLNGLSSITKNDMLFFADDSSLHASHNTNNLEDVRKTFQHILSYILSYIAIGVGYFSKCHRANFFLSL